MVDTLIVIGPDGQIKTVNQATCDMLGYQAEELVGKPAGAMFAAAADAEKKRAGELEKAFGALKSKTNELERFYRITIDRELDMVALKGEVNVLLTQLGQPKKYAIPEKLKEQG